MQIESTANLFNGTWGAINVNATDRSNKVDASATIGDDQVLLRNSEMNFPAAVDDDPNSHSTPKQALYAPETNVS